jgi:hypothetical protein
MDIIEHTHDAGAFAFYWFMLTGEHICRAMPRTYTGAQS